MQSLIEGSDEAGGAAAGLSRGSPRERGDRHRARLPPSPPQTTQHQQPTTGPNGSWSPALTVNKVVLSLRSMLASNSDHRRPPGDAEYCARVGVASPKQTRWNFDDDTV